MHNQDFFNQAFVYLMAAVVSVPLAKKLGLGSVLGYLLAGIAIGPFALGMIGQDGTDIMHFAEFGVVMMLFLIGLELKPSLLWKMRGSIFGLGGLQVLVTTIVIAGGSMFFKHSFSQAISIGLILAISSTAIVIQSLAEKKLLKTESGKSAFSVLLFQDIAVIPILAVLPLLAQNAMKNRNEHGAAVKLHDAVVQHDVSVLDGWLQLLVIIGLVVAIILTGRFISRHIFRFIASTGIREIFTAAALLMVISIALAMEKVGLSPALGTFLAGMVLADNEYRHEIETDIEPFKGLLLGLFFIAVGAGIDFKLFFQKPFVVLFLLGSLIIVKFIVLLVLGKLFRLGAGKGISLAMTLAQGGEFAFVLISFSQQNNLFSNDTASLLIITVALSMAITPVLLIINEKLIQPLYVKRQNSEQEADNIDEDDSPVIIAGFGRFGLIAGRLLIANGIKTIVLDNNPKNIQILRKFGLKVYYGDASRPDLLHAAGADKAKVLILAIDDKEKSLEIAEYVKRKYPHLKLLARAIDLRHLFEYFSKDIRTVKVEVFDSAVEVGKTALKELGFTNYQANRAALTFKEHNRNNIPVLYEHWLEDKKKYIREARRYANELEEQLIAEKEHSIHDSDSAWDSTTIREEINDRLKGK